MPVTGLSRTSSATSLTAVAFCGALVGERELELEARRDRVARDVADRRIRDRGLVGVDADEHEEREVGMVDAVRGGQDAVGRDQRPGAAAHADDERDGRDVDGRAAGDGRRGSGDRERSEDGDRQEAEQAHGPEGTPSAHAQSGACPKFPRGEPGEEGPGSPRVREEEGRSAATTQRGCAARGRSWRDGGWQAGGGLGRPFVVRGCARQGIVPSEGSCAPWGWLASGRRAARTPSGSAGLARVQMGGSAP